MIGKKKANFIAFADDRLGIKSTLYLCDFTSHERSLHLMGAKPRYVGKILYGSCVGLAVLSLWIVFVYACIFTTKDDNAYDAFYPGRQGDMGKIVYALCVLPLFSFIFLFLGFVFNSCNCCRCLAIIFAIVGAVLFLGSFVVECLCVAWGGSYKSVRANYDYYKNHEDFRTYVENSNGKIHPGSDKTYFKDDNFLPPKFTYYTELLGVYIPQKADLCYFETEDDARNNQNAKCLGSWSLKKLLTYYDDKQMEAQNAQKDKDSGKELTYWEKNEKEFNRRRDNALFSKLSFTTLIPLDGNIDIYPSLYLTCSYMIALNTVSVICFVLQFIINCCCKGSKDGSA